MRRLLAFLGLLAALLTAAPAAAQLSTPTYLAIFGSKPAVVGAPAVNFSPSTGAIFNRDTSIGTATSTALGTPGPTLDTTEATFSIWVAATRANNGPGGADDISNGFGSAMTGGGGAGNAVIRNNNAGGCEAGNGSADGWCLALMDNSTPQAQYNFNSSATPSSTGIDITGPGTKSGAFANGRWNHVVGGYKQGSCFLYKDAVSIGNCPGNIATAITQNLANSHGLFVWNGSFGWVQDVYVNNVYMGCTGAAAPAPDCTGNNTISPSQLAKFNVSGRAVDLGPTCALPSGSQPPLCLTGDATAMQTNKGYATGLALRGLNGASLATGARLDNAPYPAGAFPAHAVALAHPPFGWLAALQGTTTGTACASGTANACLFADGTGSTNEVKPNSGGQPLQIGDVRGLVVEMGENSGSPDHALICPTTSSGTWTKVVGSPVAMSSDLFSSYFCWITVTSGVEEDYVPGVRWSTAYGFSTWTMFTWRGVGSVAGVSAISRTSASTTLSAVGGTVGGSAAHVVDIYTARDPNNHAHTYAGGGKVTYRPPAGTSASGMIYTVERDLAAGASKADSLTSSGSEQSINFQLELVPS